MQKFNRQQEHKDQSQKYDCFQSEVLSAGDDQEPCAHCNVIQM